MVLKLIDYTHKIDMQGDTLYLDLDNDLEWVSYHNGDVYITENAGEEKITLLEDDIEFIKKE